MYVPQGCGEPLRMNMCVCACPYAPLCVSCACAGSGCVGTSGRPVPTSVRAAPCLGLPHPAPWLLLCRLLHAPQLGSRGSPSLYLTYKGAPLAHAPAADRQASLPPGFPQRILLILPGSGLWTVGAQGLASVSVTFP